MIMDRPTSFFVIMGAIALLMLVGCNSGMNTSSAPGSATPQRGQLLTDPPILVATYTTSELLGLLTRYARTGATGARLLPCLHRERLSV